MPCCPGPTGHWGSKPCAWVAEATHSVLPERRVRSPSGGSLHRAHWTPPSSARTSHETGWQQPGRVLPKHHVLETGMAGSSSVPWVLFGFLLSYKNAKPFLSSRVTSRVWPVRDPAVGDSVPAVFSQAHLAHLCRPAHQGGLSELPGFVDVDKRSQPPTGSRDSRESKAGSQ